MSLDKDKPPLCHPGMYVIESHPITENGEVAGEYQRMVCKACGASRSRTLTDKQQDA